MEASRIELESPFVTGLLVFKTSRQASCRRFRSLVPTARIARAFSAYETGVLLLNDVGIKQAAGLAPA